MAFIFPSPSRLRRATSPGGRGYSAEINKTDSMQERANCSLSIQVEFEDQAVKPRPTGEVAALADGEGSIKYIFRVLAENAPSFFILH